MRSRQMRRLTNAPQDVGRWMQYRVEPEPDLAWLVLVGYDTKDEAVDFACRLIGERASASHAMVWRIEGPNGFTLERAGPLSGSTLRTPCSCATIGLV